MHRLFICILLALTCFSCFRNESKLSLLFINLNSIKSIDANLNTDSLTNLIFKTKAEIIEIKQDSLSKRDNFKIYNDNYIVVSADSASPVSNNSILLVNKNLLHLSATSQHIINSSMLQQNKNIIYWYKFKYIKKGYIFYVFKLHTQVDVNSNQSKLIAFNLLNKINEVSSGAPVIILNNEFPSNNTLNQFITSKWIDHYNFNEINNQGKCCVQFFINDFFKLNSLAKDTLDPNSYCKIRVRFSLNMNNVKKNVTGNSLSDLITK